jgi:hypothetical protein
MVTVRTFSWLEKGNKNMDFLVEKRLVPYCAECIITFWNSSNGNKKATMNQANMFMAYLAAAKKLCTEENLVLRFTYIDNFISWLHV